MNNDVEAIKQRLDVVDVIRDYLTLKQSGTHFKAVCPFHHEKSPSFMVNKERQIWHCFGCHEGGDIFTFVQRIENIDFREALRLLAEKAGIELTNDQKSEVNRNEKTRLLDIVQMTALVYHRILREVDGARDARAYLQKRGVSDEMIAQFQVGYSSPSWDVMTQYLIKRGVQPEDCVKAGITIQKTEGRARLFDRFRGRIMFPIWDTHGRVIGFTGRILVESKDNGGKYVNTPETPLFHKGNVVYALHLAKQAIKEKGYAVLVEGQMDVIACHQAGMKNVVACSGTALTVEQLRLLKRYTDELRMAFDADAAGQQAAERSVSLALAEGFVVKIISIPEGAGKDADECLKKNPDVWFSSVEHAPSFMDHMMNTLLPERERTAILSDARRKHQISQKIISFIALIPSAIERDHWIQRTVMTLQVSTEALHDLIKRVRTVSDKKPADARVSDISNDSKQMYKLLEERILALLQEEFSLLPEARTTLDHHTFFDDAYGALYNAWINGYTSATAPTVGTRAPVTDPTLELLLSAVYSDLGSKERQLELRTLLKRLRDISITQQKEELTREIQQAEASGNTARLSELLLRYQQLIS